MKPRPAWSHHIIPRGNETWLPEWSAGLGDPAPNAPKWFATVEMIRLAADPDWLHKATKEVAKFWRQKRERQQNPLQPSHTVNGWT
jgi:hypothetical protein